MIDIAEGQTLSRAVDNYPDIATDPDRPEVLVLGFVELVKAHSWLCRVQLQIEGSRLDGSSAPRHSDGLDCL